MILLLETLKSWVKTESKPKQKYRWFPYVDKASVFVAEDYWTTYTFSHDDWTISFDVETSATGSKLDKLLEKKDKEIRGLMEHVEAPLIFYNNPGTWSVAPSQTPSKRYEIKSVETE